MFISLLYFAIKTILIIFLSSLSLIILLALYLKLKLEPVNRACTSKARLDGKVALVTGGNAGIGLETARDLAARGARVIIACRDAVKSAQAIADIIQTTGNTNVEFRPLDLASFKNIRQFAADFNKSYDQLNILVNNAGCAGLKPKVTEDGIDIVMQVNYFGPFLLTKLLMEKLIASKPSRIVIVSSALHNRLLFLSPRLSVDDLECKKIDSQLVKYANSKLCDVLWTRALAKRLPDGVIVNALHPGIVKTDIFRRLPAIYHKILMVFMDLLYKTPKEGAQTTLHLCVAEEVDNISGKYFMECKEAVPSSLADDEQLVETVWKKSMMMTN